MHYIAKQILYKKENSMKKIFLLLFLSTCLINSSPKPKLVVFISIDQFRYEYLERFEKHFSKRGFRLFLDNGANLNNSKFLHSSNETGPGHAVLMSGSYANVNGIIANEWFNNITKQKVYCVEDTIYPILGISSVKFRSPRNFHGTTVGDELKLSSNFKSKVFSVSFKDRSAILMGGKLADAAYFMNAESVFTTSTYYLNNLPKWVSNFNSSEKITSFVGKSWTKLLPEKEYEFMGNDDVVGESIALDMSRSFPHKIDSFIKIINSPFGNEFLFKFTLDLINEEKLGEDEITDLLCVGLSSNDYVGHTFGPNSHEVMDMTIRTDRQLEEFFNVLDKKIGLGNILISLSADHGIAPIPEIILEKKPLANAGRVPWDVLISAVENVLIDNFGKLPTSQKWLSNITGNNIYLNREALKSHKIEIEDAAKIISDTLLTFEGIAAVYFSEQLQEGAVSTKIGKQAVNSFYPTRSGDLFFQLSPNYVGTYKPSKQVGKAILTKEFSEGANHGEPWDYDSHVPVLFYGVGIKKGDYPFNSSPADIAPTLSYILGISSTSGNQGNILYQILK